MVVILLLLAWASCAFASPLVKRGPACVSGLYIIVARGSKEHQGEGKPSEVSSMIKQRVPGSVSVAVDYPASLVWPPYVISVIKGIYNAKNKVEDYVNSCGPQSRIVLIGYSQGANVMTDLLSGGLAKPSAISTRYRPNIKAVVLFGDPAFIAGRPWDVGNSTSNGIFSVRTSSQMALLASYSKVMRSYCDEGDPFCARGVNLATHKSEVPRHAAAAVDFVVNIVKNQQDPGSAE